MSTQVLEQVQATLTSDQQARAAALAARQSQHASETPAITASASGASTTSYSIAISDNGGGFAQLGWTVASSLGQYVIQTADWVGVFTNYNQALVNPGANYLGGSGGWAFGSDGGSFTTNVPLEPGYVAAYIAHNAAGNWVALCISAPYSS